MSDRQEQRQTPPGSSESEAFERLDALSRPLAERVLRRAIELHHDEIHGPDRISRRTLEQIAGELGVDPEYVRRALLEELETSQDAPLGWRERLLAPDRVTGGRVVHADADTTRRSVVTWMGAQEGLRPRARVGDGVRWERDDHWTTKLRRGLGRSEGTGALRNLPSVTHRHTEVASDEHLVEIDADTSIISKVAGGVGGGLAAAGLAGGIVSAAAQAGGNDLLQFLAPFLPAGVLGIGAALAIAKGWLAAVRSGIDRALDGIANPGLFLRTDRRGRERRGGIGGVIDEVARAFEDLFE